MPSTHLYMVTCGRSQVPMRWHEAPVTPPRLIAWCPHYGNLVYILSKHERKSLKRRQPKTRHSPYISNVNLWMLIRDNLNWSSIWCSLCTSRTQRYCTMLPACSECSSSSTRCRTKGNQLYWQQEKLRLITKGTNKLPHYVQSRNVKSRNVWVVGYRKISQGPAPPHTPSHLPNNWD